MKSRKNSDTIVKHLQIKTKNILSCFYYFITKQFLINWYKKFLNKYAVTTFMLII